MVADAEIDGLDDLLGDVDGLDDGGEERVRGVDAREQRGAQLARRHQHHLDLRVSGEPQLRRQRPVQGGHARLGRRVVRQLRGAQRAEHARHRHDRAAALRRQHPRQERLDRVEVRQEVRGYAAVYLVERYVEQALANDLGGVVDEDCGRAEL